MLGCLDTISKRLKCVGSAGIAEVVASGVGRNEPCPGTAGVAGRPPGTV